MRLVHIRFIALLLLLIILSVKKWFLMPYWVVMTLSLEILNNNKNYLQQRSVSVYNILFVGYLALMVWDRTRSYHTDFAIEWQFNSLVHILFGWIICFKIHQYFTAFNIHIKNSFLYIALIFNILGFFNELMQNIMNGKYIFTFTADTQKDLMMNIIGTMVFIGLEYRKLVRL